MLISESMAEGNDTDDNLSNTGEFISIVILGIIDGKGSLF